MFTAIFNVIKKKTHSASYLSHQSTLFWIHNICIRVFHFFFNTLAASFSLNWVKIGNLCHNFCVCCMFTELRFYHFYLTMTMFDAFYGDLYKGHSKSKFTRVIQEQNLFRYNTPYSVFRDGHLIFPCSRYDRFFFFIFCPSLLMSWTQDHSVITFSTSLSLWNL